MIAAIVVVGVSILFIDQLLKERTHSVSLSEVIPDGRIVSREDGIVDYKGKQFILGTDDLSRKKHFIESLHLLELEDSVIVDMRFRSQIIIRGSNWGRTNTRQSAPNH